MAECGPICCSIIVGHFGLGCSPITTKFDINIGCAQIVTPPIPAPPGGGGGGSVTHGGFYVPLTQKTKQLSRTLLITVKFSPNQSWRKLVAVEVTPPTISVKTTSVISKIDIPTVDVNGVVSSVTFKVSTSFNQ